LADDHALVRRGIADVLDEEDDMQVVAEARSGEEAVRLARELGPSGLDLVLMDVDMPGQGGIESARQIASEFQNVPVVMLSVSSADKHLFEAVTAGAVGYLNKGLSPAALVRALRFFHAEGALPMSRTMAAKLVAYFQQTQVAARRVLTPVGAESQPADNPLTPREREVLALVAEGLTDEEVAGQLVLSAYTAKKHVQNIMRKLGLGNRVKAAAWYLNYSR
jgi:DNA-binding NarL/FixJ family response regulator